MSTYYRGDTSRPEAPPLTVGTWLTTDPDVACWYGAAHRYEIDPAVLDLTALGVDGDGLAEALGEAGVEGDWGLADGEELYQLMERRSFLAACAAAGYDLVAGMQWHADRSDEEYEAAIVCRIPEVPR